MFTARFSVLVFLSGCGLFGGRGSSQSTAVNVAAATQEIASVHRHEYDVLRTTEGTASARQWFLLWFPVGTQKTHTQLFADAYFDAVENMEGCDAVLFARTRMRTVFVPTMFVNLLSRRITLKGRCIRMLDNSEFAEPTAPAPMIEVPAPSAPDPEPVP